MAAEAEGERKRPLQHTLQGNAPSDLELPPARPTCESFHEGQNLHDPVTSQSPSSAYVALETQPSTHKEGAFQIQIVTTVFELVKRYGYRHFMHVFPHPLNISLEL